MAKITHTHSLKNLRLISPRWSPVADPPPPQFALRLPQGSRKGFIYMLYVANDINNRTFRIGLSLSEYFLLSRGRDQPSLGGGWDLEPGSLSWFPSLQQVAALWTATTTTGWAIIQRWGGPQVWLAPPPGFFPVPPPPENVIAWKKFVSKSIYPKK